MKWNLFAKATTLVSLLILTAACGGGGGGGTAANDAPVASAVSITDNNGGSVLVGDTLTGTYTYSDTENDAEGTSTFRWLRNGTAIGGATASTYVLVTADSGQSITFEVTPVAASGTATGTASTSAGTSVANSAPTASAPGITDNNGGQLFIGDTITGTYTYNDVDADAEGTSTFRWLRNGSAIGSATALTYVLVAADSGQNISFEVTPVAATGTTTGTAVESSAVVPSTPLTTAYSDAISFPTPKANLGETSTATITGKLTRNDANAVAASDINFISVNGVFATLNGSDPSLWTVQIPVSAGSNNVAIATEYTDGTTDNIAYSIDNDTFVSDAIEIVIDTVNNRGILIDVNNNALIAMSLTNGGLTTLSDANTGTGPTLSVPREAVLDAANTRLLVIDSGIDALVAVDLSTGNRSIISNASTGTGTAFSTPRALTLDSANNRVLVVDSDLDTVTAVALANGDRTVISGGGTGTGPGFSFSQSIVLDGTRALVSDGAAIFAVDLASGNRSILSDASNGTGTNLSLPRDMQIDGARVVVLDRGVNALMAVDLASGNRSILSDSSNGTGTDFQILDGMALDTTNNRTLVVDEGDVIAVDASGNRSEFSATHIGTGTGFSRPEELALDSANNRLFVVDIIASAIVAVDLATGNRTTFSGTGTGTGTNFVTPRAVAVDSANNRLLVIDSMLNANEGALYAVDMSTGNRSIISDNANGTGTFFNKPVGITLDSANNRALVVDVDQDALYTVDLTVGATLGDRSILSGNTAGIGTVFTFPQGSVVDSANSRILVFDSGLLALFAVDTTPGPTLGDRTIISQQSSGTGNGPAFSIPRGIALDGSRALVVDAGTDALMAIDLATGDRSILSDANTGNGTDSIFYTGIAFDSTNNRVFATDRLLFSTYVIDPDTGDRATLSRGH